MTKRVFPIKVEPACLLKWSWSTVHFHSGSTSSCHRTKNYKIDPDNFANFHNVEGKLRDRQEMLAGRWPGNGCEYCRNVEHAGQVSDRLYHLGLQGDPGQHPPELNQDPAAVNVTPTILEVWFTNTCNMACVYCGPRFSSLWEDENRRFGKDFNVIGNEYNVASSVDNPHYDRMVKDLWRYLEEDQRYLTLRRFHVVGGEPFLLKETDSVIDFWQEHGNINLVLSIITNLNIPHERFKKYISKFEKLIFDRKIWKIQITASLDGWGAEQEYVRWGLDLALWEKNFEYLVDKQWITLSINSTLSALIVKQFPALLEKINAWNLRRGPEVRNEDNVFGEKIDHSFNTTGHYANDNLYIFGGDIFRDDFDQALDLVENGPFKTQLESVFIAVQKQTVDKDKIEYLKKYLDELDYRRNTDWQTTFPWLAKL